MSLISKSLTDQLNRLPVKFWILLVCVALSGARVAAQTDCTAYNNCVTETTTLKLTGNLTYSFDNAALTQLLGDPAKVQDFKTRLDAAAADWATKTGRTISRASSGSTGNVTITVDDAVNAFQDKGSVTSDPTNSQRRVMTFSDDWSGWTSEGRDRLSSHEWATYWVYRTFVLALRTHARE